MVGLTSGSTLTIVLLCAAAMFALVSIALCFASFPGRGWLWNRMGIKPSEGTAFLAGVGVLSGLSAYQDSFVPFSEVYNDIGTGVVVLGVALGLLMVALVAIGRHRLDLRGHDIPNPDPGDGPPDSGPKSEVD